MKKRNNTILTPKDLAARKTLRACIRKACKFYAKTWPSKHRSLEAVLIEMLADLTQSNDCDLIDALSEIRRDDHGFHL